MRCREVRERILPYLSGDMEGRKRAEIEAHLASCPECAEYCDSLYAVESRLQASLHKPVNLPGVADAVMAALPVEQARRNPWKRWIGALGALAVAAVLAVVIWSGQLSRDQEHTQTVERPAPRPVEVQKQPAPPLEPREDSTAQVVPKPDAAKPKADHHRIAQQTPPEKRKAVYVGKKDEQTPKSAPVTDEEPPVVMVRNVEPVEMIVEQGAPVGTEDGVYSETRVTVVASNNSSVTQVRKHESVQVPPAQDAGDIERYDLQVIEQPLAGRGGI